ncbi:hypothetical protein [Leuconostoc pseudomesenteroides]|uniref:hypothetical protein n=1 Tax=Leuconostoc pseudomesenteroides TaxID=33968 RepID=UPI0032DEA2F1
MKTVRKDIRGLDEQTLNVIEDYARKQGVTSNELLRELIIDYAKRIQEIESSKILHAYIDDLISANNELIQTQNQNTLVIGKLAKTIIERLDFYLPEMDTPDVEEKTKSRQKGENNSSVPELNSTDFE